MGLRITFVLEQEEQRKEFLDLLGQFLSLCGSEVVADQDQLQGEDADDEQSTGSTVHSEHGWLIDAIDGCSAD